MSFLFFGKKRVKRQPELENLVTQTEMNLANNYKDEAQRNLKLSKEKFRELQELGALDEKQAAFYEERLNVLSAKLDHFSHADQKPYWTRD